MPEFDMNVYQGRDRATDVHQYDAGRRAFEHGHRMEAPIHASVYDWLMGYNDRRLATGMLRAVGVKHAASDPLEPRTGWPTVKEV